MNERLNEWLTTLMAVEWAAPWVLALLPLPLLVVRLPPWRSATSAFRVPFFSRLLQASGDQARRGAHVAPTPLAQTLLVSIVWIAVIAAAARPQWVAAPIVQQRAGRDLMVAVDLSGSMEARDFTTLDGERIDRLTALKQVLGELAAARAGDRLGLVVFGDGAYLQSPFTDDHETWRELLNATRVRMAGPSTAMGDAIGLAIKLFADSETEYKVLLLLTDGNDTGSVVPPVDAARVAASRGIRIYPIAIGDPATVGEEAIDIDTLDRVAVVTGGQRFIALNRSALEDIVATLEQLEPALFESISNRPRIDLHWIPLATLLLLAPILQLVAWLAASRRGRRTRS